MPPIGEATAPAAQSTPSATVQPYDFAQPEIKVDIPVGNAGASILHVLRKPKLEDYIAYFKSSKRVSHQASKFEWVNKSDEVKAKVALYDALIERGEGRPADKTKPKIEWTRADLLGIDEDNQPTGKKPITSEEKIACIDAGLQLARPQFEVLEPETTAEDEFASLFERDDLMRVQQLIGPADNPIYRIVYAIKTPEAGIRQAFGNTSVSSKERYDKQARKDVEIAIVVEQGPRQFAKVFDSIELGGVCNGEAFAPDKKALFLKEIDPWFQYCVIDRAVASFDRARDSR